MAKSAAKAGGTSRIRFVMLDAEIPDGDLSQITQAIQNALKPAVLVQHRLPNGGGTKAIANDIHEQDGAAEVIADDEIVEIDETPARQPRTKRSTPRTPNVVTLDMKKPVSLETFANGKDAKSQNKKFIIAAAWLKEHRDINAVSEDHIYTCFRSLGWPTNIPDFAQPLRDLKRLKYFDKSDAGYEINHLGLDFANKLGGSNGVG